MSDHWCTECYKRYSADSIEHVKASGGTCPSCYAIRLARWTSCGGHYLLVEQVVAIGKVSVLETDHPAHRELVGFVIYLKSGAQLVVKEWGVHQGVSWDRMENERNRLAKLCVG